MARLNRQTVSAEYGGYHIISRITGGDFLLDDAEKDYFLNLLRRFAAGYFVRVHSFAIMSNHFHLLVTMADEEAFLAGDEDLAHRIWTVCNSEFRKKDDTSDFNKMSLKFNLLNDIGVEKVRERLGSVSRFVQDLKQYFARYFNEKYHRLGCLWGDRFKGIIISHGNAQLACSAYIDLNPVRADIVKNPEDYRWCSLGLMKSDPQVAKYLLTPVHIASEMKDSWSWYKLFVYESGSIAAQQEKSSSEELVKANKGAQIKSSSLATSKLSSANSAQAKCWELQLNGKLIKRVGALSEGVVVGTTQLISHFQEKLKKRFWKPQKMWSDCPFFTSKVFR